MQISKTFLVVCAAAACCAFPLSSRSADTEAQIKAREALDKKMKELQSQQPAPAPGTAVPAPRTQPKPPVTQAPVPQKQVSPPPVAKTPPVAKPAPPVKATPPPTVA